MKAFFINIKDISYEEEVDFLLSYVDEKKKEKSLKFIHNEDRIRTLIGDLLARAILCKDYNFKNSDIIYCYNEFNKPYLSNNQDICFNVSHSGDYVAVAFDDEEIGIDIEEIKEMEYEEIVERFFTKGEYDFIKSIPSKDRVSYFYKLWTLKESYVKFKGKGMSIPFSSFEFCYEKEVFSLKNSNEKLYFNNYNIENSYEMSLCSLKDEVSVKEISYSELKELIIHYL